MNLTPLKRYRKSAFEIFFLKNPGTCVVPGLVFAGFLIAGSWHQSEAWPSNKTTPAGREAGFSGDDEEIIRNLDMLENMQYLNEEDFNGY